MNHCIDCRFANFAWRGAVRGECRRSAPTVTIGQIDPASNYSRPETAAWPGIQRNDGCGDFQADAEAPMKALTEIVRERIFGDGTADCEQRVIDLCREARERFGIEREG